MKTEEHNQSNYLLLTTFTYHGYRKNDYTPEENEEDYSGRPGEEV